MCRRASSRHAAQCSRVNRSVCRLPFAGYLRTSPGNHTEGIAGERAPAHLRLALELFPAALNDVTIHINPLRTAVVCCMDTLLMPYLGQMIKPKNIHGLCTLPYKLVTGRQFTHFCVHLDR